MSTLITGTIIAVSSSNWFTCWLGLEINLISIIPLILNKLTPQATETAIKYFLAQAIASLILIYASVSRRVIFFSNFIEITNTVILISLVLKAGIPPLHFWFPQVIKSSNWRLCILILTWQKIAPLTLISYLIFNEVVSTLILISCVLGPLGGLNQTNIKIILTYSSITHSAWMIAIIFFTFNAWIIYFLVYSTISVTLILIVKKINIQSLKQISITKLSTRNKIIIVTTMIRLGGLPPLLGFLPKLAAIQSLISSRAEIISLALVSASLLSLFYYMRVLYSVIFLSQPQNNFYLLFNQHQTIKILLTTTTMGNLIIPMGVLLV